MFATGVSEMENLTSWKRRNVHNIIGYKTGRLQDCSRCVKSSFFCCNVNVVWLCFLRQSCLGSAGTQFRCLDFLQYLYYNLYHVSLKVTLCFWCRVEVVDRTLKS